ncbi:aspartyl/asparaginyl beta-hydroxylase domain-containing protein [Vibrio navarrensis]|nr:aspartyl/asparaginyl beta-hydroxylase domain-containing protein [Vibrio navarrensis]
MDRDYYRLRDDFLPLAQIQKTLGALNESDWVSHVNRACYEGGWQVYPLRGLAKYSESSPILQSFALEESQGEGDYVNYPAMKVFPELEVFLSQLCCPLLSIRLMRLMPGAVIHPHRDRGLCFSNGQARLHLSLTSEPDVEFIVNGESVYMAPGELWYLNADCEHAVYHRGEIPRVHLVIDCLANDWLRNALGLPEHRNLCDDTLAERQAWLSQLTKQIVYCVPQARYTLRQPVRELVTSFANLVDLDLNPTMFVDDHFTMTNHGKAVSMLVAAKCGEEFARTAAFLRGIYQAIEERQKEGRPVSVLYAGTGPFATLLLPLMSLYSAKQLQVTMLDIHSTSLEKLGSLVSAFGLQDRVENYVCSDATDWTSEQRFDLLVSETMKAALDTEPQVSVFSNLVLLLKEEGALIPQTVEMHLNVVDQQGKRTPLDICSRLDKQAAELFNQGDKTALDIIFQWPFETNHQAIEICTEIQVYGEHWLRGYDCSLNLPFRLPFSSEQQAHLAKPELSQWQLKYHVSQTPGYRLTALR